MEQENIEESKVPQGRTPKPSVSLDKQEIEYEDEDQLMNQSDPSKAATPVNPTQMTGVTPPEELRNNYVAHK